MNGNKLKLLFYFILFIIPIAVLSQTKVNGKVMSTEGNNLTGASVMIIDKEDRLLAYAITGDDGNYSITVEEQGFYIIEVGFLGFSTEFFNINTQEKKNINQDFKLKQSEEVLKEVFIEAEQPIKRHGDTLIYDAKLLSKGTEVVVEDLLKNIPGITIQDNGKIMYGNKSIEKIMVEGDDLFNKGYSLLTKNMDSKPLKKVEILQNYSNNKLLKGIEPSDGVAINLTLDENFKKIWFGDVTLGYGNDNRYATSGNIMNFSKSYKIFSTLTGNNAGYDRIGDVNEMMYNSSEIETIGATRAVQAMSLSAKAPRLNENRMRFNNAKIATLSTIFPLGSKAKLKLIGFLNFDLLNTYQDAHTVRNFGDTYFENFELNSSRNNIKKNSLSAVLNYDISKTSLLQISSTLNNGDTNFKNDLTFNDENTWERLKSKNNYFDQKMSYTHQWKNRNAILIKGRFFSDKVPQYYGINDYLMDNLFPYTVNSIDNSIKSSKQFAGLATDFKFKQAGGDLIAFTIGFENNNDNIATKFRLFTDTGIIYPDEFQLSSKYNVGDLYAFSRYTLNLGRFSLSTNINIHQFFNRITNIEREQKRQSPFFINPLITATWEINSDNILSGSYMYNSTNSNLLQVNDNYLLTSSRSFSKGLGDFNQFESSAANIGFTRKHYLNRYSFSGGVSYSRLNNIISYRSQIEQNSALSEAFIIRGGDRYAADLTAHFVIKKLKGSLQISTNTSRTVSYNEVNGSGLRKNIFYSQVYDLSWKSNFKSDFNFNIGGDISISKIKSDYTFNSSSAFGYADLIYKVNKKFNIQCKGEYYFFGGEETNNKYFFTDLLARYSFKDDKYVISFDARNLLNITKFITYNISDVGYAVNSYRLLPRYILLSFRFRF